MPRTVAPSLPPTRTCALRWVHLAEVDSFLTVYNRYGDQRLDANAQDGYVADTAHVAQALGVIEPPQTVEELHDQLDSYRPELTGTPEARSAARFLVFNPPLPLVLRPAYAALAAAAVNTLPFWARWPLRLPYLPVAEEVVVRAAGQVATRTIRWAMSAPDDVPA